MNSSFIKVSLGLLIASVVAGNFVTIFLLLDRQGPTGDSNFEVVSGSDSQLNEFSQALADLRKEVQRLSSDLATQSSLISSNSEESSDPSLSIAGIQNPNNSPLSEKLDNLAQRFDQFESTLKSMKELNDEVSLAKLRETRNQQFRTESGFTYADELIAEKKFAVGANGIMEFLDEFPDHPDARDLMGKARQAYFSAGYSEKAIWVHEEMMKKFPKQRGRDLYNLAMMVRRQKKLDKAIELMNESVELSATPTERANRMFYRAYLIHTRDGDNPGLQAYREVEEYARNQGTSKNARDEAQKRANEIEKRLNGE